MGPWFWTEQLGWRTMWPISRQATRLLSVASRVGTQSRVSGGLPHKAPQGLLLSFLPHSQAFLASNIQIYPDTAFHSIYTKFLFAEG